MELADIERLLPPDAARRWYAAGGRSYMLLRLSNGIASEEARRVLSMAPDWHVDPADLRPDVLSGELEVAEGGPLRWRRRGAGAVVVQGLTLTWVSSKMGGAAQYGGGGMNGEFGGRQVTEVARLGRDDVAVAWRNAEGFRGQLSIRSPRSNQVFEVLDAWMRAIPAQLAALEAGDEAHPDEDDDDADE